jgi:hypothetical protein
VQEVAIALLEKVKQPHTSLTSWTSNNNADATLTVTHAIKILISYAHKDEILLQKLKTHLAPLRQLGLIDMWYDQDINAGIEWEREINDHLNTSQIILLLVSPDFMASNYCYSIEMKRAFERHERGEARVIPIILRPVLWQLTLIGKLQVLPANAKAITDPYWITQDRGFHNVAEGINKVIEQFVTNSPVTSALKRSHKSSCSVLNYQTEPFLCYCSRCKKKTPMKDAQQATTKNNLPAVKGICSVCGTNVYLILAAKKKV